MRANVEETHLSETSGPASRAYPWYVVGILTAGYAVHGMDRMIINVLIEPIRKEFSLSDTALGLLSGLGYAVPFALAGLPLGILIDRVRRKRLLALLIAIWSALTFAGGLAWNYSSLLFTRMGVGAAESGSPPAALSLISDYFPARIRASAVSFFYMGAPIGAMLGAYFGGLITQAYSWRTALFASALPGFVIALVISLSVAEPKRGEHEIEQRFGTAPTLRDCARFLRNPGIICIVIAIILASMSAVGVGAWITALLMRAYTLPVGESGQLTALISIAGILGTLVGGVLADRMSKGQTQRLLLVSSLSCLASAPPLVFALAQQDVDTFIAAILVWDFVHVFYFGPAFGLVLSLAPSDIRGRVVALLFILVNILGAGLGPQAVGAASDYFASRGDPDSLAHAVMLLAMPLALSGLLFFVARSLIPHGITTPLSPAVTA